MQCEMLEAEEEANEIIKWNRKLARRWLLIKNMMISASEPFVCMILQLPCLKEISDPVVIFYLVKEVK